LFQQPITRITGSEGSGGVEATRQAKLAACHGTILGAAHLQILFVLLLFVI
jgi:hypothetical protein